MFESREKRTRRINFLLTEREYERVLRDYGYIAKMIDSGAEMTLSDYIRLALDTTGREFVPAHAPTFSGGGCHE